MAEADLAAARETAEALAALRTRRGTPRLHPPGDGRLAPRAPRSRAERQEGELLLRELCGLGREARPDLVWFCAASLLRATRSNSGLKLTHPGEVAIWLRLTGRLSPRRWALHLEGPADASARTVWEATCPPETPWRPRPGMSAPVAVARLPRPDGEAPDTRLGRISTDYASGAPLFAAHGFAIAQGLAPRDLALHLVALEKARGEADAARDYAREN
jgi:hypothetical protein